MKVEPGSTATSSAVAATAASVRPGDEREQVDAVESGHSLDDEHQAGVPGATLRGPTPAKESLGTGRVYAAAGEAAGSGRLCEHVFA